MQFAGVQISFAKLQQQLLGSHVGAANKLTEQCIQTYSVLLVRHYFENKYSNMLLFDIISNCFKFDIISYNRLHCIWYGFYSGFFKNLCLQTSEPKIKWVTPHLVIKALSTIPYTVLFFLHQFLFKKRKMQLKEMHLQENIWYGERSLFGKL